MEFSLYEGIKYFIKNGRDKLPKKIESDTKLAKQIRNMSHLYTIKDDGLLYFGPRQDREVVREDEFEEVMAEAHDNGGHFGETQTYGFHPSKKVLRAQKPQNELLTPLYSLK